MFIAIANNAPAIPPISKIRWNKKAFNKTGNTNTKARETYLLLNRRIPQTILIMLINGII